MKTTLIGTNNSQISFITYLFELRSCLSSYIHLKSIHLSNSITQSLLSFPQCTLTLIRFKMTEGFLVMNSGHSAQIIQCSEADTRENYIHKQGKKWGSSGRFVADPCSIQQLYHSFFLFIGASVTSWTINLNKVLRVCFCVYSGRCEIGARNSACNNLKRDSSTQKSALMPYTCIWLTIVVSPLLFHMHCKSKGFA